MRFVFLNENPRICHRSFHLRFHRDLSIAKLVHIMMIADHYKYERAQKGLNVFSKPMHNQGGESVEMGKP